MNRQEKEKMVVELRDKIKGSQAVFLVNYRGLSVAQMDSLRAGLRNQGGSFKVAKARLMKRAVEGMDAVDAMAPYFKDQIGLVFADDGVPTIAQTLHDFSKEHKVFDIVLGSLDARLLSKNDIIRIASLPSKEVLIAQVCATLNAPIADFTRVLHMLVARLLYVLKKIEEQK